MLIHERLQRIINNSVLCTYSVGGMYVAENYNIVCKLLWQNVDFATQHFHIIVDRIDYCIIGSAKEDGDNEKVLHRLCTVYREYSIRRNEWKANYLQVAGENAFDLIGNWSKLTLKISNGSIRIENQSRSV